MDLYKAIRSFPQAQHGLISPTYAGIATALAFVLFFANDPARFGQFASAVRYGVEDSISYVSREMFGGIGGRSPIRLVR
jgi:hypothetical protein